MAGFAVATLVAATSGDLAKRMRSMRRRRVMQQLYIACVCGELQSSRMRRDGNDDPRYDHGMTGLSTMGMPMHAIVREALMEWAMTGLIRRAGHGNRRHQRYSLEAKEYAPEDAGARLEKGLS